MNIKKHYHSILSLVGGRGADISHVFIYSVDPPKQKKNVVFYPEQTLDHRFLILFIEPFFCKKRA